MSLAGKEPAPWESAAPELNGNVNLGPREEEDGEEHQPHTGLAVLGSVCSQAGTPRAAPEVGNPSSGESNLSFETNRNPLCFWKSSCLFGVVFWDPSSVARGKMIPMENSSLITSTAKAAAEKILLQQQK